MKIKEEHCSKKHSLRICFFLDVSILILEIYFAERRSFTGGDSDSSKFCWRKTFTQIPTHPPYTHKSTSNPSDNIHRRFSENNNNRHVHGQKTVDHIETFMAILVQSCAHFGSTYHLVTSSSLWCKGLEGAGPTVLGRLPTQTETTKGFRIFGILTQHNPTHESCCFTKSQTQHANIRPRKALALTQPLHPPTSAWHTYTSKASPGRLEESGPYVHGSMPAAFCLNSMEVLYCQDSVTQRARARACFTQQPKVKGCLHCL